MAVHDWTRVSPGTYRDFHCRWITHLSEMLNSGVLPTGYNVPLEATYLQAWHGMPERWRKVVEGGK